MRPIHLFYSWQSDRDRKICANFIKLALEMAIERLKSVHEIEIVLDSDTAGVPGTPPVSETILEKIRNCDIFVGDVTFVGETPNGKRLPNPNVMTEFGFARALLGDQQIVLVMNTAFGPEPDLPFDLAHLRHPTAYELHDGTGDGARRSLRAAFAEKLGPRLEAVARKVLASRDRAKPSDDTISVAQRLIEAVLQLNGRNDVPAIVAGPKLSMQLAPAIAGSEPHLDPASIKAIRPKFLPAGYEQSANHVDASQWAFFDPPRPVDGKPNPEARWYTRLVRPGVLDASIAVGARIDDDPTILVEAGPLEARVVETAERLAEIAAAIGLDGPLVIRAALHGVEDMQMMGGRKASRRLRVPAIALGMISVPSVSAVTVRALRPLLDALWLGSGFEDGSPSFVENISDADRKKALPAPIVVVFREWR